MPEHDHLVKLAQHAHRELPDFVKNALRNVNRWRRRDSRYVNMHVKELHIWRFRGFSDLTVRPKGHVVVMGEPGAGRSNLVEGLARVLDADASRTRITTELDFHNSDTSQPVRARLSLQSMAASPFTLGGKVPPVSPGLGPFSIGGLPHCSQRPQQLDHPVRQQIAGVLDCAPAQDVGRVQRHLHAPPFQVARLPGQTQKKRNPRECGAPRRRTCPKAASQPPLSRLSAASQMANPARAGGYFPLPESTDGHGWTA